MDIVSATRSYEQWLARQLPIVPQDLKRKHERMAESSFVFLRGTFYRWAQLWPHVCAGLADAPAFPSIGDLHIENFGTCAAAPSNEWPRQSARAPSLSASPASTLAVAPARLPHVAQSDLHR